MFKLLRLAFGVSLLAATGLTFLCILTGVSILAAHNLWGLGLAAFGFLCGAVAFPVCLVCTIDSSVVAGIVFKRSPTNFSDQPLYGYRIWDLCGFDDAPRIQAIASSRYWTPTTDPNACKAACHGRVANSEHPVPHIGCTCGWYSFKELRSVIREFRGNVNLHANVIGRIAMWGDVIETERGFRAEYAYPATFYLTGEHKHDDKVKLLANKFGVETEMIPCKLPKQRRDEVA